MNNVIEKAKSGRAKCFNCENTIEEGTLKLVVMEKGFGGYDTKKSLCLTCGKAHIKGNINELNKQLEILER